MENKTKLLCTLSVALVLGSVLSAIALPGVSATFFPGNQFAFSDNAISLDECGNFASLERAFALDGDYFASLNRAVALSADGDFASHLNAIELDSNSFALARQNVALDSSGALALHNTAIQLDSCPTCTFGF